MNSVNKKKILFLIGNLNYSGGTERVCSIIANKLSHIGYEINIVSITGGDQPFFTLSRNIHTHSLFPIDGRVLYRTPAIIYKLRSYLKKEKINTLIVVDTISVLFTLPAIQGLSIKHICWEHFNFNNDLGKVGRRLARQLAARYCDTVVTLTECDKRYWLKGTKHKGQITTISNPSPFAPQKTVKEKDTKTVLAVGRLTPIKGFDLLIKAWVKVATTYPDWKLDIVGEGENRQLLTDLINRYQLDSKINLVGTVNNVEHYYKRSDIFCLSSRYEGFGMVLVEALSFGLPIISFDCEVGPAEVLENTGAILVPPENIDLLADALIDLIKNKEKRKTISIRSIEKSKVYQPEAIVNKWVQIIDQ